MKCRTCGKEFDPRIKKTMRGGFYDQCVKCSTKDRKAMYLGRMGEKCESMEVFRKNLPFVRTQLKLEAARGPHPNLNINNPANQQVRDAKEEEGEGKKLEITDLKALHKWACSLKKKN